LFILSGITVLAFSRVRRRTASRGFVRWMLWRLMWLAAGLSHVVAVLRDGLGGDAPLTFDRGVMLLLGVAYCALKVLDVPWLRVRSGWRAKCACLLILVLLHVGMLRGTGIEVPDAWLVSTTLSAALLVVFHLRDPLARVIARLGRDTARHALERSRFASWWQAPIQFLFRDLPGGALSERAPPISLP
jgi:hypothetical protein